MLGCVVICMSSTGLESHSMVTACKILQKFRSFFLIQISAMRMLYRDNSKSSSSFSLASRPPNKKNVA